MHQSDAVIWTLHHHYVTTMLYTLPHYLYG